MTSFPRNSGLVALGLSVALLSVAGCAEDNEAAVKAQAAAGKAGEGDVAPKPQAKNMDDYAKQYQQQQKKGMYGGGGYPGAKK